MIFVDINIFYNILYETDFTLRAKMVVELLEEPVTSVIVNNELLHVAFRAYAKRKYGITSNDIGWSLLGSVVFLPNDYGSKYYPA